MLRIVRTRRLVQTQKKSFATLHDRRAHAYRDIRVSALIPHADIRVSAVRCGRATDEAAKRWGWSRDASLTWGRNTAHTVMYSGLNLKGEERVKAELMMPSSSLDISTGEDIDADGDQATEAEAVRVFSEALAVGEVRGFMGSSNNHSRAGGTLRLERVQYGKYKPHVTAVESGAGNDVDAIWQEFFDSSEQVPTCAVTMAQAMCDDHGQEDIPSLVAGIVVQAVPGTDGSAARGSDSVAWIRQEWASGRLGQQLGEMVHQGPHGLENFLTTAIAAPLVAPTAQGERQKDGTYAAVHGGHTIDLLSAVKRCPVDFFCRCSKENFIQRLAILPPAELNEMEREGGCELTCHMCNAVYAIGSTDLAHMVQDR